jgi:ABC-type multidrug transport system fused ATPase/permease subunit
MAYIEIKNLKFKYPNTDKYIINGLNLKIEDGKHYIFVGENGAGKSTIIKIITGLFDDYEGEILINNKNIKEYSKAQLKYIYSGVYQDFAKYNISIKDNIAIGNFEEFDNIELIREKTKLLGIDDDFVKLKNGYNTMVGKLHDESVDLSGGQWQKVAMARALVSNASIQILDEPTSALDPISESTLYEEFEKISKGRTTIFISHRLGAVKIADYIYLIHNGVVEESGTHDELIKNNGMYTEMYNSQKEWYIGGNE